MPITQIDPQKTPQAGVLIIGCGDIGQRLAQQLADRNYQVTGLRRTPREDLPYLKFVAGDASNPDVLSSLIAENFNVIVITMTPTERSDQGYQRAYVDTCQQLVNALHRQKCQPDLLLFVSSTSVYAQDDGGWITEQSPATPESFSGKRLLDAEKIITESGFNNTIVRFSGIYGPGRNRLIEQVKQTRASASTAYTNRIHADDCAGVLAHLIQLSRHQSLSSLYLASDCYPTPMIDVVRWIAAQLGIEKFLSAEAINERGNKRISNQRLLQTGYQFIYRDYREGYMQILRG